MSNNELYVTFKSPIDPIPGVDLTGKQYLDGIGYEWFESLLHLSCKNAEDKTDKVSIFNEIWADFENNEILNRANEQLFYYYHWDQLKNATNTGYLLKYRDSQCYAWGSLLIDLLKIQGIDQTNDLVLINSPPRKYFLVKKWNTLNNPFTDFQTFTPCNIPNSYTFIFEATTLGNNFVPIRNIGNEYYYYFYYNEVEDVQGLTGQGAENPESWFVQHCIVYLDFMNKFYDPSYGKAYNSVDEFISTSIDMWVCEGDRSLEEIYDELDPNHNFLPSYDFNGDGDLDDWVNEFRGYTDLSQFYLISEFYDR